jgi:hypothetical protein
MSDTSQKTSAPWGWIIIVLLCAGIIGWGLFNYAMIKDRQRAWNFGALPDAPSQSIYSTVPATATNEPPKQIFALPEAKPWQRPPPGGTDPSTPRTKGVEP